MTDNRPIGIFDSGIGGLTVAAEIAKNLPNERIIYFGDTAHLPYGDKSAELIQQYAENICRFLEQQDCKLIVIACNSASAVAYDMLVEKYRGRIPIVNVAEPIARAITAQYDLNTIGIIGTRATISSGVYARNIKQLRPELEVRSLATPLLAPMIEEGFYHNRISHEVIENYLEQPVLNGIETLVLACTHYPLIKREIETIYQGRVKVFDSTDFIAFAVRKILEQHGLEASEDNVHENHFYVSDHTQSFEKAAQIFFGQAVKLELCNLSTNFK